MKVKGRRLFMLRHSWETQVWRGGCRVREANGRAGADWPEQREVTSSWSGISQSEQP